MWKPASTTSSSSSKAAEAALEHGREVPGDELQVLVAHARGVTHDVQISVPESAQSGLERFAGLDAAVLLRRESFGIILHVKEEEARAGACGAESVHADALALAVEVAERRAVRDAVGNVGQKRRTGLVSAACRTRAAARRSP